jgi:hypothetical protein
MKCSQCGERFYLYDSWFYHEQDHAIAKALDRARKEREHRLADARVGFA